MASTFSDLKIELIGTGEQSGTWGTTTNTNLGTAIEEAIVGSADVSFSSADVTLTLINTNNTQSARHLRLNLTGTSGGARNLILGSGCQIDKPYIINNGLADTVTVKNTTGTGVDVPAGKSMWVYNNGTNVVKVVNVDLTADVFGVLPIANGGTGITSFGTGVATALGQNVTGSGGVVLATSPTIASPTITSPTLTTPVLGTPSSGTLTNCTGLPIVGGTTGTLSVARGGTGATSLTANNVLLGNGTSAPQVVAPSTSGNVLSSNGSTWVSSALSALSSFDRSLAGSGYQKFPGGLIIQWGTTGSVGGDTTVTINLPIAFPSTFACVVGSIGSVSGGNEEASAPLITPISTSQFTFRNTDGDTGITQAYWVAIGY